MNRGESLFVDVEQPTDICSSCFKALLQKYFDPKLFHILRHSTESVEARVVIIEFIQTAVYILYYFVGYLVYRYQEVVSIRTTPENQNRRISRYAKFL